MRRPTVLGRPRQLEFPGETLGSFALTFFALATLGDTTQIEVILIAKTSKAITESTEC